MKIRFREVVESSAPGFPFVPGQVIEVDPVPPELRTALSDGRAEAVKEDKAELAVVPTVATPRRRSAVAR